MACVQHTQTVPEAHGPLLAILPRGFHNHGLGETCRPDKKVSSSCASLWLLKCRGKEDTYCAWARSGHHVCLRHRHLWALWNNQHFTHMHNHLAHQSKQNVLWLCESILFTYTISLMKCEVLTQFRDQTQIFCNVLCTMQQSHSFYLHRWVQYLF